MRVAAGAVLALAGAPAPSHTHSQPEPESWLPSWQQLPSWGGDAARQWARRRLQEAPLACDTIASLGDRGLGLWGTDLNTLGDTVSSACKPHRRFAGGATNANGGNNTFVMAAANAGAYVHGAPITAALMDAAIADPSSFACDEGYVLDTEVTFQCCTAGGAASLSGQPCKVEVQESCAEEDGYGCSEDCPNVICPLGKDCMPGDCPCGDICSDSSLTSRSACEEAGATWLVKLPGCLCAPKSGDGPIPVDECSIGSGDACPCDCDVCPEARLMPIDGCQGCRPLGDTTTAHFYIGFGSLVFVFCTGCWIKGRMEAQEVPLVKDEGEDEP